MPKFKPRLHKKPQAHSKNCQIFKLDHHMITAPHRVHFNNCRGGSKWEPRIYQGNQIHGFGCPVFETGTTWILFFFISRTEYADIFFIVITITINHSFFIVVGMFKMRCSLPNVHLT